MAVLAKENKRLASRAFNNDVGAREKAIAGGKKKRSAEKLSTSEAAKKILGIIESDMQDKNLSEKEKNLRAGKFAAFVDNLTEGRRKS
jgi:23S rRNA pseudoU1915 N3-methylase RlmH